MYSKYHPTQTRTKTAAHKIIGIIIPIPIGENNAISHQTNSGTLLITIQVIRVTSIRVSSQHRVIMLGKTTKVTTSNAIQLFATFVESLDINRLIAMLGRGRIISPHKISHNALSITIRK